jgi:NADH dehydrogenase [ubiquinone] 1 alpha subcomplex assembly factor 7
MPVSLYMLMCLHDPRDGYYATRPGFNHDFTTAPETSQVFGELMGSGPARMDAPRLPTPLNSGSRLGPGRGTMMKDMLRRRQREGVQRRAHVALVEASPPCANSRS